jgi:uncharacterized protein involved in response to NO
MRTITVAPPPTAWELLAQVPHRAYFSAGVGAFVLLALWWSVALPIAGVTAQPSVLVHGLMMPLGIFPSFMLGFVFTAGPRWLGTQAPKGHLPLALGQLAGLCLMLLGFMLGGHWPLLGLTVLFVVWWWATWLWFDCIARAPQGDHRHAHCILFAMLAGNLALLAVMAWVISNDAAIWLLARNLILWGWIVPIFLVVAHRMIPFFTQSVLPQRTLWRPVSILQAWLAGCAVLAVSLTTGHSVIAAIAALALALATGYTAWRWAGTPGAGTPGMGGGLRGAYGGNRLLAMLHLSFAWLPVAFVLLALEQAGVAVGTAATHAIGMGFCTTMMVGFVTRVSLGHSGRPLQANNVHWLLYLGLHAAAALRVAAALTGAAPWLLHATATLWLLVILTWATRMLPFYWQPRADGQPG